MKIQEKTFKKKSCCRDYTLYQFEGGKYWLCGDCFLTQLMVGIKSNTYFVETEDYKKGFNLLMEYFDSISDEEKPKVDKQLKRLGL